MAKEKNSKNNIHKVKYKPRKKRKEEAINKKIVYNVIWVLVIIAFFVLGYFLGKPILGLIGS